MEVSEMNIYNISNKIKSYWENWTGHLKMPAGRFLKQALFYKLYKRRLLYKHWTNMFLKIIVNIILIC